MKTMEFDKLVEVSVAATNVERKGQHRIRVLLDNCNLPPLPEGWDWSRLVQEGKFRGRLPKRVATYYKKEHNEKVPLSTLTSIGNKVDQHSFGEQTYILEFTKRLDWNAGDFGDFGSCFWGCRNLAREALMKNNVFAVKFYRVGGSGYARAFVLKVDDGLIIFNAYGLSCKIIAYVLATLFDYPHRKDIELYISGDPDGLIWLNEDAHQIGLTSSANTVTVEFEVPYAQCNCCDRFCSVDDGDYGSNTYEEFMCFGCQ